MKTFVGVIYVCFLLALTGCNTGGSISSNSAINMAGTWTIKAVSTQGHGNFSGTASVSQSGVGLGVNGTTTFTASIGSITVSQSGTALTGTLTNSIRKITYNFTGTLSGDNFTITGSTISDPGSVSSTAIIGPITSNSVQGTYTITRSSGSYYPNDAGTFVAAKQ